MNKEIITSRQNPLVKFVCGLADKKRRNESGLFRFDGIKLLREAAAAELSIKHVICREPLSAAVETEIQGLIRSGRISENCVVYVSESVFEKLSEEKSPEGVLTVAHTLSQESSCGLPAEKERILIAESLRDPGNLGTVMRSCYALGIDRLVLTDDCADAYNPRTVRAAMGALFRMKVQRVPAGELCSYIEKLRESGRGVYAAALSERSVSIFDIELKAGDCFVIGNEGHGLTESTVEACTRPVIIPMREGAESLNAAAAAAICIWETVKA